MSRKTERDNWINTLPRYNWYGDVKVLSNPDHLDYLLTAKLNTYKQGGMSVIGFDSEQSIDNPKIGTIQIATMDQVWILCRAYEFCDDIRLLWFLARHKKVGFGIKRDLGKLGQRNNKEKQEALKNFIEIDKLNQEPEGVIPKGCPPGAKNLCARLFGLNLDKSSMLSHRWHEYPLKEKSLRYAVNDVSMHLKIYVELMHRRANGIFDDNIWYK